MKRKLEILKPIHLLSDGELTSEIHKYLIWEYKAKPRKLRANWLVVNNNKLILCRWKRLALAHEYIKRERKISPLLLKRNLPSWKNWPGTISFFERNIYQETKQGILFSHKELPIET